MNPKFFDLPQEKQQTILNAGYRVFSQNTYKKSPMSEIAAEAGISKSLLFHYFRNKKELYLFLLETAAQVTAEHVLSCGCYEQSDVFEMMHRGLQAKVQLMKRHPDMSAFVLKAYYEKDPAICQDVQALIEKHGSFQANSPRLKLDSARFIDGLDLRMMYQDMYWAGEGYLWEKMQQGTLDMEQMERDYKRLIDFWKSIYLKKEVQPWTPSSPKV